MHIETTVLIPNFNGKSHLPECLSSLLGQVYKKFKVVLIDDCSIDGSIDYVRKYFPQVKIISFRKNLGFAKAINYGIKYSIKKYQVKYIAPLNNDVKVDKNWLRYLVKAIESEKNVVAVASNMLSYYDHDLVDSHGGTSTITGEGYDINKLKRLDEVSFPKYVLSCCFGAALLKSRALKKIGLLDERYFSYHEDLDWGWRANLFGHKIIFEKKAIVYHKGGASWKNQLFRKKYLCKRNSLCTMIKNYELKSIIKIFPRVFLDYFIFFPIGYLINRKLAGFKLVPLFKYDFRFCQRFKHIFIPLRCFVWNLKNLDETLRLRRKVQLRRKVDDLEIIKMFIK